MFFLKEWALPSLLFFLCHKNILLFVYMQIFIYLFIDMEILSIQINKQFLQ